MVIPLLDTAIILFFFIFLIMLESSENSFVDMRMLKHPEIQDYSL